MSDQIGKLLERVAQYLLDDDEDGSETVRHCVTELEEKLGPLLRAGLEMAEHIDHGTYTRSAENWRRALAALNGEK